MEKNETYEVDKEKRMKMFQDIRVLEGENLKTGKYDDRTMVNEIGKIINKVLMEGES